MFVYISSATANVQFDIQAISTKLAEIPTSSMFKDFLQQICL